MKLKKNFNAVTNIIGTLLLVGIVVSGMSALMIASTTNNSMTLEQNIETNEVHTEFVQKMEEFQDNISNINPNDLIGKEVKIGWVWPKNGSIVLPAPECKVYLDGPPGYVVTVYFGFLFISSDMIAAVPPMKTITTQSGSVVSFKYNLATTPKTTYYWAVGLCHPGGLPKTVAYYSFTIV